MKLRQSVIDARKIFAKSVDYDIEACVKEWRISRHSTKYFIREYCFTRDVEKPVYENQRLFDMQVLTRAEWCRKWEIPLWEYDWYLNMYQRKHGEIATPEIRAEWEREYWEKM